MTRTRNRFLSVPASAAIIAGVLIAGIAARAALKSGAVFTADKGNFRILVSGQQMGKEEFEISPNGGDWTAKGTSEVQTADGATHVSGSLQMHADGTPVSYEWSTQGAKKASSTITFNGPVATIELRLEGRRPFTQQFTFNSPQIVVLDNNLYYQYGVLARLYDRDKKGVQTFSVLVPQELTPGSVTVESLGEQNSNGGNLWSRPKTSKWTSFSTARAWSASSPPAPTPKSSGSKCP
jgi:hypothetical protein